MNKRYSKVGYSERRSGLQHSQTVASICHKSWGSRPEATSLPPSILLSSLTSRELLRESGQSPLTRCQHFDAIYAWLYKMHIDV